MLRNINIVHICISLIFNLVFYHCFKSNEIGIDVDLNQKCYKKVYHSRGTPLSVCYYQNNGRLKFWAIKVPSVVQNLN